MSVPRKRSRVPSPPLTWDAFKSLVKAFPAVEDGTSWGTPAVKVGKKMLARLREDGDSVVIGVDIDQRTLLVQADPDVFYYTDHYANYPAVLIRLSAARAEDVTDLIEQAWRDTAPKKVVAAYDAERDE